MTAMMMTGSVRAATVTGTFNVTATVIAACTISTANIAFGNYDPTASTALAAQGSVSANCTKGASVTVSLDQGSHAASGSTAAVPVRQMIDSSGDLLPYHIYTASGGTTEWGTGTSNQPAAQTSASVATALVFPTYGSIATGADVPAGTYADTVTATLTF